MSSSLDVVLQAEPCASASGALCLRDPPSEKTAGSLGVAAAPPLLARELDFRMANAVVPSERIRPAEGLLVRAKIAANLLLPRVVDGVFVSRKIVGPREYCVAWLPGAGVDPVAFVRAMLRVVQTPGQARHHRLRSSWCSKAMGLSVTFPLVLLEKNWGVEAQRASVICAGIGAAISARDSWPLWHGDIGRVGPRLC